MKRLWQLSNAGGEPCEYVELDELAGIRPTVHRTPDEFADAFLAAFRRSCNQLLGVVEDLHAREGRELLAFHSAGYDSRVWGACVHDRLPDHAKWVVLPPEQNAFRAMMRKHYQCHRHILVPVPWRPNFNRSQPVYQWLEDNTDWRRERATTIFGGGYMSELLGRQWPSFEKWVAFYHSNGKSAEAALGVPTYYPALHPEVLRVVFGSATPINDALRLHVARRAHPALFDEPRTIKEAAL